MWWGMDCRTVQQNLDLFVDGFLSESDRQQLFDHAANCAACKKAIDDAVRLKNALASLGELEPPRGLAMSAIKQARKKKPIFAYISVGTAAVAAAVALVMVLGPGSGMDNSTRMSAGAEMYSESAAEEAGAPQADMMEAPQEARSDADGAASDDIADIMQLPVRESETVVYLSEEEFTAAEASSYFKPAALPHGAELGSIAVDDESILFTYTLADGGTMAFEWLDALEENGLTDWLEKMYGDLSVLGYDGVYYTITSGGVTDVYFEQNGDAFHITLPGGMDFKAYGSAQFVDVPDADEEQ